jgi:hypothetical protein
MVLPFDPEFDDTVWTENWVPLSISQLPSGTYAGGYRVERQTLDQVEVFGQMYQLTMPLDCSFLYDPAGLLWMSNTPQERIMMYNNGLYSWGNVLVAGLGLGLYPQYAAIGVVGEAVHFTVIEQSAEIRAMVEPMLRDALHVPLEVDVGEIEAYLSGPIERQYDTIFLDTWETLDAARLPAINRLRDMAIRHLSPDGRVLLWGYGWMLRLFLEACLRLLEVDPPARRDWLDSQARTTRSVGLLWPVLEHFQGEQVDDLSRALAWCREHIVHRVE